jgi:hypothetical protein
MKAHNQTQLDQANIRRWLDKRVPLSAKDAIIKPDDLSTFFRMVRDWKLPLIIRKDADKSWSVLLNEGTGCIEEYYVLECNFSSLERAAVYVRTGMQFTDNDYVIVDN